MPYYNAFKPSTFQKGKIAGISTNSPLCLWCWNFNNKGQTNPQSQMLRQNSRDGPQHIGYKEWSKAFCITGEIRVPRWYNAKKDCPGYVVKYRTIETRKSRRTVIETAEVRTVQQTDQLLDNLIIFLRRSSQETPNTRVSFWAFNDLHTNCRQSPPPFYKRTM